MLCVIKLFGKSGSVNPPIVMVHLEAFICILLLLAYPHPHLLVLAAVSVSHTKSNDCGGRQVCQ